MIMQYDSDIQQCITKTNLPFVAVLMSTYNGERFLTEQLDSILNQRKVNVSLFIRDDGSTDKTIDIINQYKLRGHRITLYQGENVGPGMSFVRLLYKVAKQQEIYRYYAFADQDDVWLPDKLCAAVQKLEKINEPALYCSNQTIYCDGIEKGLRYSTVPDMTLEGHITRNQFSGCTMVMNQQLLQIICSKEMPSQDILSYRLHDAMIFLEALLVGKVIYDPHSYINYRIHEGNTVGLKTLRFKGRWKRMFGQSSGRNLRKKTAEYLLKNFSDMSENNRIFLEKISDYQEGFAKKIRLIQDRSFYESSGEKRFVLITKIILNLV